mmetsp:Transcript_5043/g.12669  ORF Transcript_5043/g.12669 Transcript_5043/m.12669 type:complete len:262 (-) Transcript_5043:43-828(-)
MRGIGGEQRTSRTTIACMRSASVMGSALSCAICTADAPSAVVSSGSAPLCSSTFTTSLWSSRTAEMSGVAPLRDSKLGLAPLSMSSAAMSQSPWLHAVISAVPRPVSMSTSAPCSIRYTRTSASPSSTAARSAVLPFFVASFGFAPASTSSRSTPRWPPSAAATSGLRPSFVWQLGEVHSSSDRTVASSPSRHAATRSSASGSASCCPGAIRKDLCMARFSTNAATLTSKSVPRPAGFCGWVEICLSLCTGRAFLCCAGTR